MLIKKTNVLTDRSKKNQNRQTKNEEKKDLEEQVEDLHAKVLIVKMNCNKIIVTINK